MFTFGQTINEHVLISLKKQHLKNELRETQFSRQLLVIYSTLHQKFISMTISHSQISNMRTDHYSLMVYLLGQLIQEENVKPKYYFVQNHCFCTIIPRHDSTHLCLSILDSL